LLDLLIPGENIFYFSVWRGWEEVKKEGFRVFFVTSNHKKVTDSPKTVLGRTGVEER
jgi:hypothetical protein